MKKAELNIQVSTFTDVNLIPSKANRFGNDFFILLRWRRSIYQLLWKHLIIYMILYVLLSVLYDYGLTNEGQKQFQTLAEHCLAYSRSVNLMIMLGFFTSSAMQRFFSIQTTIPGIAKSITVFASSLKPNLPEGPAVVEQFARWQLLSWILCFRLVCRPLRQAFPDLVSLEKTGLMSFEERLVMEKQITNRKNTPHPLIAVDWILLLLKETMQQDRFFSEFNYLKNVDNLMTFKKNCGNTIKFGRQNIPPSIVQAVVLAVYGFGIITLMGRSFSENDDNTTKALNSYVPFFPALQFFIYFAWLCFGKAAVDPFGDDDDDIDVRELVQSHVESCSRLKELYTRNLEEIFPDMPYRQFNDSAHL